MRGYKTKTDYDICFSLEDISEVMILKKSNMVPKIDEEEEEEEEEKPNQKKCPTCDHWVPEFSFSRHEAFCSRNSWKCRECGVILKVQFKDDHYHCPKCKLVTNKVKNIFNILPFFCCYLFFFYFFTFFFLKNHF